MPTDRVADASGAAFEPIAIVGQGCLLPGCDSPEALWALVHDGLDATAEPAPGLWGTGWDGAQVPWTTRGGYVNPAHLRLDASQLALSPELLNQLDGVFLWSLHAAQQAMQGVAVGGDAQRAGVVLGNLSYPTQLHSRWAEQTWVRELTGGSLPASQAAHPLNRFMSGLPAMLVARAFGLQGGSLALDAACASGLYAIKVACDRLHDRSCDLMLAGAVNAADQLFLHAGFHALQALSASGRSRPFQQGADGLLPAEGAVFVALKRLADAQAQGDTILGVIRGVGLSNDGRSGGFLSPSQPDQVRSMQSALRQAGLTPDAVQYVECHATGTQLGDATELASLSQVYGSRRLALGSLKANLGHLITASGLAGLVKTLAAMRHGRLPATPGASPHSDALVRSGFEVLASPRDWPAQDGQRTAAISSFGFGGNNAHLILQQHAPAAAMVLEQPARPAAQPLAIVGLGLRTHLDASADDWARRVLGGATTPKVDSDDVRWPARGLSFPPADLKKALGQQLLVMEAARQACAGLMPLDSAGAGVYVGMQTDTEVCRHGARARWPRLMAQARVNMPEADQARVQDAMAAPLDAATVIGTMPNVVANRLSSQYDLKQPGFAVSREELSGDEALALACRALRAGEAHTALVAAVDLGREAASQAAMQAWPPLAGTRPADAAVALVIKTAEQAEHDGDRSLAWLLPTDPADGQAQSPMGHQAGDCIDLSTSRPAAHLLAAPGQGTVAAHLGHAHAAQGLLNLALGIQMLRGRVQAGESGQPPQPLLSDGGPMRVTVENRSHAGEAARWTLQASDDAWLPVVAPPALRAYAGRDTADLIARVQQDLPGGAGPCRLALVGDAARLPGLRASALSALQAGRTQQPWALDGMCFQPQTVGGEVGFVFTGAASAYAGMGRDLLLGLPQLAELISHQVRDVRSVAAWMYAQPEGDAADAPAPGPMAQLAGASALCQLHAAFSQHVLGLRPDAALGLSSGETNALFALGAWQGIDGLFADISASGLYERELSGHFDAVREHWGLAPHDALDWQSFRVRAPVAQVREAAAGIDRVYLTIVNSPVDVVIGGDAAACDRLLQALGRPPAVSLGHDLAVHCAAVGRFGPVWQRLHTRPTTPPPGIRFYASHHAGPYALSDTAVAEALTGQALTTADFSRVVERAWADGVRVFIEHGPRNTLCAAIDDTLGARPHLAVALDRSGVPALHQAWWAAAQLWCAGVPVDLARLAEAAGGRPAEFSADVADAAVSAGPQLSFALRPVSPALRVLPAAQQSDAVGEVYMAPAIRAGASQGEALQLAPAVVCAGHVQAASEAHPVAMPGAPMATSVPWAPSTPVAAAVHRHQPAPATQVAAPTVPLQAAQAPAAPLASASVPTAVAAFVPAPETTAALPVSLPPAMRLLVEGHARMAEAHRLHVLAQQQAMDALMASTARWRDATLGLATQAGHVPVSVTPIAPVVAPASVPVLTTAPAQARAPVAPARSLASTVALSPAPAVGTSQSAPVASVASIVPTAPTAPTAPTTSGQPPRPQPTAHLPGPRINRAQLEVLAGGRIADVLGPAFAAQDAYPVQVRMPQPPLLLCDRVLGIEGEHHSMGRGTIWTETDVQPDAWYMHHGRMSPGVFIECGQADLLLISWLGIDEHNRGERAYRLLGCELVFHGDLPQPGETLHYEIKVDGHARQGDVRLFFFHYDCHVNGELRISVRQGQAGFFTKDELAHSAGVIWSPQEAAYTPQPAGHTPPAMATDRRAFTLAQMRDYLDGDLLACFGPSHRLAATHNRTPRGPRARLNLLDHVTQLDPTGGPAGRGYLRIETDVHPDDWYFDGHFKNDPCMPGTLMADACLQAMSFYMVAMGLTLARDGWRFQPVRGERHRFLCRGQVTPASERIVYEVFVDECIDGPQPRLYAHLLCTVDGRKAFLCERAGLELVPDWPLATLLKLPDATQVVDSRPVAHVDGLPLNHATLLQCAWGRPSLAFGPRFTRYDGPMRSPRLPGPPYHFLTRITELHGELGQMKPGAKLTALYDIDPDAWYFRDQPTPSMPNSVLLEAVLQPCGWLAVYTLDSAAGANELLFRNLDGHWRQVREVRPTDRTLCTEIELTSVSSVGGMVIEKFAVRCSVDGEPVLTLDTVFGFFPPQALADQRGLPHDAADLARLQAPGGPAIALRDMPPRLFGDSAARLPDGQLLMIDRITGHWPDGGAQGLGVIRAEKDVRAQEWFFKAHFFQDPVQPGSLGIEAILQAAQSLMLLQGMDAGLVDPCFEPLAIDEPVVWHYRGQVTPQRRRVTVVVEALERRTEPHGVLMVAQGQLWVDGMLAYRMPSFGMRLKSAAAPGQAQAVAEARALSTQPGRSPFLAADGTPDWRAVHADWLRQHPGPTGLAHDLCVALLRRFVRRVVLSDPGSLTTLAGRPVMYVANHQTGVESLLCLVMATTLWRLPTSAIAKAEHTHSWMGRLLRQATAELGPDQPLGLLLFDRARPEAMLSLLQSFAQAQATAPRSLLVHADGTRALQANQPVNTVSAVLIDLALSLDMPIVPVRFTGGLPVDPLAERADFPHGLGTQDIHFGSPLWPQDLRALSLGERSKHIVAAIGALGPAPGEERPHRAQPEDLAEDQADDEAQVQAWVRAGMDPVHAVLRLALQTHPLRGPQAEALLQAWWQAPAGDNGALPPART